MDVGAQLAVVYMCSGCNECGCGDAGSHVCLYLGASGLEREAKAKVQEMELQPLVAVGRLKPEWGGAWF